MEGLTRKGYVIICASLALLVVGCGGADIPAGASTGTSNGVSLETTVEAPASASLSLKSVGSVPGEEEDSPPVEEGSSISKSASSSGSIGKNSKGTPSKKSTVSIAKASTAVAKANTECSLYTASGTLLGTGKTDASGKAKVDVDLSLFDVAKGIMWECGTLRNFFASSSSVSKGQTVSCGTTNPTTTVVTQSIFKQAGVSSPDPKILDLKNPYAIRKTFMETLSKESGASASQTNVIGGLKAMEEFFSNCLARGGSCTPQDVHGILDGNSTALTLANSYVPAIDFSNVRKNVVTSLDHLKTILADSAFLTKMGRVDAIGGEGKAFQEFGRFMFYQGADELEGARGAVMENYMGKVFDQYALDGDTNAFKPFETTEAIKDASKIVARFSQQWTGNADGIDYGQLTDVIDGIMSQVGDVTDSLLDEYGAGLFNQFKVLDDAGEKKVFSANDWITQMQKDPTMLAGEGGDDFFQNMLEMKAYDGQAPNVEPCYVTADCSTSGYVCGPSYYCIPSGVSSTCKMDGCPCSVGSDCDSGYCPSGYCDHRSGFDAFATLRAGGTFTPGSFRACLPYNAQCTSSSDCCSLACISGACYYFSQASEAVCNDGVDNNANGLTDCADTSCSTDPACGGGGGGGGGTETPITMCGNNLDDDSDGLTDCADTTDCANYHVCGGLEINCTDSTDNDGDSLTDCLDTDCSTSPSCVGPPSVEGDAALECSNALDDDSDGTTDCLDSGCSTAPACVNPIEGDVVGECSNLSDDDGDSFTDCLDLGCLTDSNCVELNCMDSLDNDSDGFTDCADSNCLTNPLCQESICDDGLDNDSDLSVDCSDSDCASAGNCSESVCNDALDNDSDGFTDCSDTNCTWSDACYEAFCSDGLDNDNNGLTDCADSDCSTSPSCT